MAIDLNIATTFLGDTDTPNTYVGQATKKVVVNALETGLEFVADSGGSTNIYTADGNLTANRTLDGDGYNLTFTDIANFRINSKIGVNTAPLSYARLYVNAGTGEYGGYFDATDEIAVYASSVGNIGVYALSTNNYGVQGVSTNSYGVVGQSAGYYAGYFQATGANTLGLLVSGTEKIISPSASALDTAFAVRNNTDTADMILVKANGAININQPTATSTQIGAKSNGSDYWVLGLQDASTNDIARFGVGEIELRKITAIGGANIGGVQLSVYGRQKSINLPTYANNTDALAGGLTADDEYKTVTGERRIVV